MISDLEFGISDLGIKHGGQFWNTEVTEDSEDCDLGLKISDLGLMNLIATDLNEAT